MDSRTERERDIKYKDRDIDQAKFASRGSGS